MADLFHLRVLRNASEAANISKQNRNGLIDAAQLERVKIFQHLLHNVLRQESAVVSARDFFTSQALVRSSVLNSYRRLGGHCTNQLQIIGLERGEGIEPISIQRSVYSCFRNQGRANRGTNALGND